VGGVTPARGVHTAADETRLARSGVVPAVLAVCLAPFVGQLNTFAMSPFLPSMARDLGAPVALLGQMPTLSMLAAALALVTEPVADRIGHRRSHSHEVPKVNERIFHVTYGLGGVVCLSCSGEDLTAGQEPGEDQQHAK
jgi:MFS family permease